MHSLVGAISPQRRPGSSQFAEQQSGLLCECSDALTSVSAVVCALCESPPLRRPSCTCGRAIAVSLQRVASSPFLTLTLQMASSAPPTAATSFLLLSPLRELARQLVLVCVATSTRTSSCAPPSFAMSARDAGSGGRSCGVEAAEGRRTCELLSIHQRPSGCSVLVLLGPRRRGVLLRALRDGGLMRSRPPASSGLTCAEVVGKYIRRLTVRRPVSDSVLLPRLQCHEARWLERDKGQARIPSHAEGGDYWTQQRDCGTA